MRATGSRLEVVERGGERGAVGDDEPVAERREAWQRRHHERLHGVAAAEVEPQLCPGEPVAASVTTRSGAGSAGVGRTTIWLPLSW